ncbi:MAG: zinc-binding alcohol dehydrogenase family protein [Candidatus Eremiobacteraeota bacterium]|nr:zinc-binding alcohol dehydrogenase family protein [Candidatus Eremiobacteraeota bacterium]
MKAAVVTAPGALPVYGDFEDPVSQKGKHVLRVTAAPLTPLARLRASGAHYTQHAQYPFVPGADGVGVTDEGRRLYFMFPEAPFGAMAERCIVDEASCIDLPQNLADDMAAALANPSMSSWAALRDRARLQAGETVLINGATGTAGRLAVRIAKHLGAGRVVATGRRVELFDELERLGADETIELTADADALRAAFAALYRQGVDVVLDYLWGASAEALLASAVAGPQGRPIRYVQIGSISGDPISVPSAALRSSSLELMGSGFGSLSIDSVRGAITSVFESANETRLPISVRRMPLSEVSKAWTESEVDGRIVFIP